MKRTIAVLAALLLPFTTGACRPQYGGTGGAGVSTVQSAETHRGDDDAGTQAGPGMGDTAAGTETADMEEKKGAEGMEDAVEMDRIDIKVGESTLTAVLEDNQSARALMGLLAEGPLTIPASNYGGFEKVCPLGTELPRDDRQTTTHAGDICLYSGDQIVIFHGSNSWAYTRLGQILDVDGAELERILSGAETEITLSIGASR